MKKVSLIISIIAIVLSVITLAVTVFNSMGNSASDQDIQYVMYLGTNDKDTNEPVFSPEDAKKEAEAILLEHFGGYTIQEANGGWVDGDNVYREYTLVISLSDTDIESVHAAAEELISKFNQSSVLIQANKTTTEFYSGNN